MNPLIEINIREHNAIRDALLFAHPELEDDIDTLLDTLEGETELTDRIAWMVRSMDDDEMMITGIKDRVSALQERLKRIQTRHDTKKAMICEACERADIPKITKPDFTLSLRTVPGTARVIDETAIPEEFINEVVTRKPIMREITNALKAGKTIAGAILGNGYKTISIRRG